MQKLGTQEIGQIARGDSIGSENSKSSMADRPAPGQNRQNPAQEQPQNLALHQQNPALHGQNSQADWAAPPKESPHTPHRKRSSMQAAAGILLSLSSQ